MLLDALSVTITLLPQDQLTTNPCSFGFHVDGNHGDNMVQGIDTGNLYDRVVVEIRRRGADGNRGCAEECWPTTLAMCDEPPSPLPNKACPMAISCRLSNCSREVRFYGR